MQFDFSDLLLFTRVVEAGSITHGAARAHRSLAAASVQIKDMERIFGAPLLVRDRLGVTPTDAGRALLQHSYRLLDGMQQLKDEMSEYAGRIHGYVKIYSNSASLLEFLAKPLASFLVRHPAVDVNVEEVANHLIPQAVREGKADFGIVAESADTKLLEFIPYRSDRYVIVGPVGGALADGAEVDFIDLLDFDFVGLGRGTGAQVMLEDLAHRHGKKFKHRAQLRGFDVACHLAADGAGIALIPATTAKALRRSTAFNVIHLRDDWAQLNMVICKLPDSHLSSHARGLIRFLRDWSES